MLVEQDARRVAPLRQRSREREHREQRDEDEPKTHCDAGRHAFCFEADEEGDSDSQQEERQDIGTDSEREMKRARNKGGHDRVGAHNGRDEEHDGRDREGDAHDIAFRILVNELAGIALGVSRLLSAGITPLARARLPRPRTLQATVRGGVPRRRRWLPSHYCS